MGKSRDKGDNVTSSTRNLKLTTHTTKYTEHAGFFFVFAWGDRGFKGVHIQPNPSTVPSQHHKEKGGGSQGVIFKFG